MTLPLTFVELFAGVGGLSIGLERAGWRCLGHAEWEDFPRRVLKHRWPDIPLWGDVSQLDGRSIVDQVGPFTMLTFGAPCQDFSVAGRREGLEGGRSVLVLDAIRIWEQSGAPLALYENVVGMLSSNKGEDFGAILSTFVGARVAVPARGWRGGAGVVSGPAGVAAWRTLDAQHFGWDGRTVPQRRRRVFVLCSRDPRVDPAEVLSLAEGMSGHPTPRRAKRQGAAADTGAGPAFAVNISNGEPRLSDVMGMLQARATSGGIGSGAQMNAVLAFAQNTRDEVRVIPGDKVCAFDQVVFPTITMGAHPAAPGLNGQDAPQMAEAILRLSSCGIPRRLTPVECERLMGWPDGHTDVPDEKGRPASDTSRYKACGNGVASPVSAWIGYQLAQHLRQTTA